MRKIKASTLTEVITALVIITLITAMFLTIVIRVGNYHKNRQKLIVHQQILDIINDAKRYNYIEDEIFDYEGYYIKKSVKSFKDIPGKWEIEVIAYRTNNKIVADQKAIIDLVYYEDK